MTISPESVEKLIESKDLGDRLHAINQLRDLPEDVAFDLIQPLIQDENPRIRYAAVSQIARLGHQDRVKAGEILRDRLRYDSEVDVQAAAADAIGGLKLTELFPELEQSYHQSSEWILKLSIVATLGEMGDLRGLPLLKEALCDDNELILTSAIGALGEFGDVETVDWLIPFVTHPDWQLRYRLTQALGHLGGDQALALLHKLAQDEVKEIAQTAREQLDSL